MNKNEAFIETKEYKRFAEFCDACTKYKYIGVCYEPPGVGKTLSARHYANWNNIEKKLIHQSFAEIEKNTDDNLLECRTLFHTAPAVKATKFLAKIQTNGISLHMAKSTYANEEDYDLLDWDNNVDLVIVDEIDRFKVQHLEQLRDIYDQNDIAMVFIGMPGVEKRLARYPQLYSRIGFAHKFNQLSKNEAQHILTYKWQELGLPMKLEDFSDYEAVTSIIRITGGNFRLMHRLFSQIERILEINKLSTITTEVVETARDSLVIGVQ